MRLTVKAAAGVLYVVVLFVSMIDTTIVNVALPTLGTRLGVEPSEADGVVIAFLVGMAITTPTSGWLGNRFGTRRAFLWAILAFAATSALCGAATSLESLTAFRLLQGMAGGVLGPLGLTMFLSVVPQEERTRAMRILMVPMVIAPASGPLIGGLIVDHLSWRWIFFVNVPIALAAFLFGRRYLGTWPTGRPSRLDVRGLLLVSGGLGAFMYALSAGVSGRSDTTVVAGALVVGIALLASHVWHDLHAASPILNLRVLSDRVMSRTGAVLVPSYAGFAGLLFALPIVLQDGRGMSALTSGALTSPEALGVVTSTQIAAWLLSRAGPRLLMTCGLTLAAATIATLAFVAPKSAPPAFVALLMFATGSFMAYAMLPSQSITFANFDEATYGQASTVWNVIMQVANALGVAISSTIITASDASASNPTAYALPLVVTAALVAGGAVLALNMPRRVPVAHRVAADA